MCRSRRVLALVTDLEELRRHVPVILADDGDRFLEGVVVHAVEVEGWLQYWAGWPGDRDHAGVDWEVVMVRLGEDGEPIEVVYAQHRSAERRPWHKVPKEGLRPIVYAERDKHASRFRAGWHRHGWRLSRANGKRRLDPPLELGVPTSVSRRLSHRDPDAWLARLGV